MPFERMIFFRPLACGEIIEFVQIETRTSEIDESLNAVFLSLSFAVVMVVVTAAGAFRAVIMVVMIMMFMVLVLIFAVLVLVMAFVMKMVTVLTFMFFFCNLFSRLFNLAYPSGRCRHLC